MSAPILLNKTELAKLLNAPLSLIEKTIRAHNIKPSETKLRTKYYDPSAVSALIAMHVKRKKAAGQLLGKRMEWGKFTSLTQIGWVYKLWVVCNEDLLYVGMSAKNLYLRYEQHRKDLDKGVHHNGRLQYLFDNCTQDNKLKMHPLEKVQYVKGKPVLHTLLEREHHWMKELKTHLPESGLNVTIDDEDWKQLSEGTRG